MERYTCTQCGAPINPATLKCEYCGSSYKDPGNDRLPLIYIDSPRIHVLQSRRAIPNEVLYNTDIEAMSRYIMDDLLAQLAKHLVPFTEIKVVDDPLLNAKTLRARLRICDPDYKA